MNFPETNFSKVNLPGQLSGREFSWGEFSVSGHNLHEGNYTDIVTHIPNFHKAGAPFKRPLPLKFSVCYKFSGELTF